MEAQRETSNGSAQNDRRGAEKHPPAELHLGTQSPSLLLLHSQTSPVGCVSSLSLHVMIAFTPATQPSSQTAQAAVSGTKQDVQFPQFTGDFGALFTVKYE